MPYLRIHFTETALGRTRLAPRIDHLWEIVSAVQLPQHREGGLCFDGWPCPWSSVSRERPQRRACPTSGFIRRRSAPWCPAVTTRAKSRPCAETRVTAFGRCSACSCTGATAWARRVSMVISVGTPKGSEGLPGGYLRRLRSARPCQRRQGRQAHLERAARPGQLPDRIAETGRPHLARKVGPTIGAMNSVVRERRRSTGVTGCCWVAIHLM